MDTELDNYFFLEIFSTKDVTEWTPALHDTDIPPITFIFSGILTHLMVLDFGTNTTITIAKPLMGKIRSSKCRVQHIALGKWLKEKYNSVF